jgi:perosamine synthetase
VIELSDRLAIDGGTPVAPHPVPIAAPVVPRSAMRMVNQLLRAGRLREGEITRDFERQFASLVGVEHAYAVSSGTAALHLVYAAVLRPGDEVLVPAFTFFATAACVVHAGGVPVPVDIDPVTFTLDARSAAARVSPRTVAIAPVHLYGHPADMAAVQDLADRHGLAILADAAQAHGARIGDRDVATMATMTAYSTYVTKNLFTGEGGLVTTNDDDLGDRVELLRSHGSRRKYVHEIFGFNYRITEPASAIGISQLDRLEAENDLRNRNARQLTQALSKIPGIVPPSVQPGVRHVFHQYTIRVLDGHFRVDRDRFAEALRAEGVETGVHYPVTINRQPAWIDRFGESEAEPESEAAAREVLSIPVHPQVTRAQCAEIALAVEKVARHYRA